MKYAWLVLGVFAARFFATAIAYPQVDGDLSWQRWLGATIARRGAIPRALGDDTFTAAGAAWTPQEWLFSLVAAHARNGLAWDAFAGGIALCALAALALAAWHAVRRGASERAVLVCLVFAGLGLFVSFGVRVQVAAWPLLALFVLLLDLEGPWTYAAIGVAAVWSNVHASAMLAPVVAALAAGGSALDDRGWSASARRRALVALGSALAICINPFGIELPRYALALFGSPIRSQITEWLAPNLADTAFLIGALPLVLLACASVVPSRPRGARDALLLIAFAYLLFGAQRNVALFGLVALPIVAPALTRTFAFFASSDGAEDPRVRRIASLALPAFGAVVAVVVGIGLLHNRARTSDVIGSRAIAYVATLPGERRLFCADFAWCGLAVGIPRVRVFLDGRADPYPRSVWTAFDTIAHARPAWRATLDAYAVDTIVVAKGEPLDEVLGLGVSGVWRESYRDDGFRVWIRTRVSGIGAREHRLTPA